MATNGWSQIAPHLPASWTRIGNPYAVAEGFIFVVSMRRPGTTREYRVLGYNVELGEVVIVRNGDSDARFLSGDSARTYMREYAARLNERPEGTVFTTERGDDDDE